MNLGDEFQKDWSDYLLFILLSFYELALLMEWKKIILIFYNVKPFNLVILDDDNNFMTDQLHRFKSAIELTKGKMDILFYSSNRDWSDLLKQVSDIVVEILMDPEAE